MEQTLLTIAQNCGPLGIVASAIFYLVVNSQRNATAVVRDDEKKRMREKIDAQDKTIMLLQKDVDYLKEENTGIKADVKEIKTTLQSMAVSLAELAVAVKKANE